MPTFFRVPALFPSAVVISRLDIVSTRRVDPVGAPSTGYDEDYREPYKVENSGEVESTRRYKAPVRIPCQVETRSYEEVAQVAQGDASVTTMVFVLFNKDLTRLGLLRRSADAPCGLLSLLKTSDRIDTIEQVASPGSVIQSFKGNDKLYIFQVLPGSWGMGPTGQDLQIVYTSNRPNSPTGMG